ncbi:iron-containing alcohol dehydrogenase, partial [Thermodesulfobacteriota bacterium]
IGGSGLIAKILNEEVSPETDPFGPDNKLVIACGPLAGTRAPQLGRISVGAKSPLTLGIKEANSGGPAGQHMDQLGLRAIVVENAAAPEKTFYLRINKDEACLVRADELRGLKNYELVQRLHSKYGKKASIVCIGIAGERKYRGASVSFTDIFGDPSRNAARGGLGAVMGAKGLKAIVLDAAGTPPLPMADPVQFKKTMKSWVNTMAHDISCALYSKYGTPFAVANSANQGTLPTNNYRSGRPDDFYRISGEAIQEILFKRGGRMHGCMPGCVVKCSIIYPDPQGKRLASAYEYEIIALLGANLGILDLDAIGRLKFICDDLGLDAIETGASLGVAADAGRMELGDSAAAEKLLLEIEQGTDFGHALGNGVVATAKALHVERVPAYKGQALPGHDPRAVKGTGVTYVTSPMGADHTAGLTYRIPRKKENQAQNSLRSQVEAAVCDTFGYCLNSVPGGQESIYDFLSELMNARYGIGLTRDDIVEIGKQTLKDQLRFNEKTEFSNTDELSQSFFRSEALMPTDQVFDVSDEELGGFWGQLDGFKVKRKQWEVRIPPMPETLIGVHTVKKMGISAARLNMKKVLVVSDPVMQRIGRVDEVRAILEKAGIASEIFLDIEPDPPVELIEKAGDFYKARGCDGIVGLGGGSSLDAAKAIALRVTHPGELTEYESIVGGTGKVRPILPPVICIPTTSGTGSEVNPYAVITNKRRNVKFMLMSNHLIPKLAVIDPDYCRSMPRELTRESGIDALSHCVEGYVALAAPYHPYFESLALYGAKMIGRSLVKAYKDPQDLDARTDMCMAAVYGGIAFSKGLGLGHAVTHVLGAHYHLPHGKAATIGLLCFVRANKAVCEREFRELAFMLNGFTDLEEGLLKLYKSLDITPTLKDNNIPEEDLKKIAFYTYRDAVNIATNPSPLSEKKILSILEGVYDL